jgi:hypothetical protein
MNVKTILTIFSILIVCSGFFYATFNKDYSLGGTIGALGASICAYLLPTGKKK